MVLGELGTTETPKKETVTDLIAKPVTLFVVSNKRKEMENNTIGNNRLINCISSRL
jgi:hypothetical protein